MIAVSDPRPTERGAIRSARQSSSGRGWAIPQLENMLPTRGHADDLIAIFAFRHFILRNSRKATRPGARLRNVFYSSPAGPEPEKWTSISRSLAAEHLKAKQLAGLSLEGGTHSSL